MELYTLTENFAKEYPIDEYISAIWTERFLDSGDVVLTVPHTDENRLRLVEGTLLSLQGSDEVMLIETQDIQKGALKVTGNTIDKALFENRVFVPANDLEQQSYVSSGTPGGAMTILVYVTAGFGATAIGTARLSIDIGKQEVTNLTYSDRTVGGVTKDFSIPRGPLLDIIKTIAKADNVGWKIELSDVTESSYALTFVAYTGRDRTSDQTVRPLVRFSPALDSLADVTELKSIAGYKTVAYAISPGFDAETLVGGSQYTGKAYAYSGAELETDFKRRVLLVEITGITAEAVDDDFDKYKNIMDGHARDALANNNFTKVVDGEVVPQSEFQYNVDYGLGDIVELQDQYGYIQKARITEYIRSKDVNGAREYPTVSVIT